MFNKIKEWLCPKQKYGGGISYGSVGINGPFGQTTMAASLPVALASNQSALPISGTITANAGTKTVNEQSVTVTVNNGVAYSSGKVIGGIISLATVNLSSGRRVVLQTMQVNDRANQKQVLDIYFFKATPSGGTYTDSSSLVWGTGDSANKVGQFRVSSADYFADASQASANYSSIVMKMGVTATTLFMLIVSNGSPTYSTGDLVINLEFDQE